MIYNVMCHDCADQSYSSIVAFESEQIAHDWLVDYITTNYGTELDMNEEGIFLEIEPTIYHKGIMV